MSQFKISDYLLRLEQQLVNLLEYNKSKHLADLVKDQTGSADYYSTVIFYSLIASIFALIANTFIGGLVGLFYPIYKMNKYLKDNTIEITTTIKYLYIYAHMEFIFQAAMILSVPFFKYIKLAITLFIMYSMDGKSPAIEMLYDQLVIADNVVWNEFLSMYRKFLTKF